MAFTKPQAATVLAALRLYQRTGYADAALYRGFDAVRDIVTYGPIGARTSPLTYREIEQLCDAVRTDHGLLHDVSVCRCQNCMQLWFEDELNEVQDLTQRVDPGDRMPEGECPECGAVCHDAAVDEE